MPASILAAGAVLVFWTLIMLIWLGFARFGAIAKANIDLQNAPPGGRGQDLDQILPRDANWKSHNYTHLMEQPTLFYAAIIFLSLSGGDNDLTRGLAWTYVAVRIVHSFWQSLVNTVPIRLLLFAISTICLFGLSISAIMSTIELGS